MSRIAALTVIVAIAYCTSCSTEPPKELTEPAKESYTSQELTEPPKESANPSQELTEPPKESANPSKKLTEPPKELTEPLKEFTNSIGMKFKLVPAGEFLMGVSDRSARSREQPQHKVRITKPFYLGMYEVTQAEYEKVMGENPSEFSKGGNEADRVSGEDTSGYPVEQVSWDDAVEFCKKLTAQEGKNYRLPTEAEWEYACRAGTTTNWFCNDKKDVLEPSWIASWSIEHLTPHPVGAKEANAWGLFDMHGNVWEWCQDWFGEYDSDEAIDPTGPPQGSYRVRRGGGHLSGARLFCLSSDRFVSVPTARYGGLGFRVALDPSASPDKSIK